MSYTTPHHTSCAALSVKVCTACSALLRHILREVRVCKSPPTHSRQLLSFKPYNHSWTILSLSLKVMGCGVPKSWMGIQELSGNCLGVYFLHLRQQRPKQNKMGCFCMYVLCLQQNFDGFLAIQAELYLKLKHICTSKTKSKREKKQNKITHLHRDLATWIKKDVEMVTGMNVRKVGDSIREMVGNIEVEVGADREKGEGSGKENGGGGGGGARERERERSNILYFFPSLLL